MMVIWWLDKCSPLLCLDVVGDIWVSVFVCCCYLTLYPLGRQTLALIWLCQMGNQLEKSHGVEVTLTLSHTIPVFTCLQYSLLKTLWEKEKLLITSNFSFPHSVFYLLRTVCILSQIQSCRLQTLSIWKSLNFVVWKGWRSLYTAVTECDLISCQSFNKNRQFNNNFPSSRGDNT